MYQSVKFGLATIAFLTVVTSPLSAEAPSKLLADYVARHKAEISEILKTHHDQWGEILEVEACIARIARFNGGVPFTDQRLLTLSDGSLFLEDSGVVGTCHVAMSGCQSGCSITKAITIGLMSGVSEIQLPSADASITAVGIIDYNE